ncbi:hypothetical protein GCM10012280_65180 [Wenjunlia tyrosinilytica]|uniref:Uncharacterized protein n=1 Tax=Wenjunlia tyrosinilytica TaxID=1544741 RepID=A0A917ZWK8_9ACTN|nr:hypothetical protein GCM10012280_65180 [Wenjunlia tyrosinilytica]
MTTGRRSKTSHDILKALAKTTFLLQAATPISTSRNRVVSSRSVDVDRCADEGKYKMSRLAFTWGLQESTPRRHEPSWQWRPGQPPWIPANQQLRTSALQRRACGAATTDKRAQANTRADEWEWPLQEVFRGHCSMLGSACRAAWRSFLAATAGLAVITEPVDGSAVSVHGRDNERSLDRPRTHGVLRSERKPRFSLRVEALRAGGDPT